MIEIGTKVRLAPDLGGLPGFGDRTGVIARHVRRRGFVYGVRLDRPYRWPAGPGRYETWREVHARADEVTPYPS